MKVLHASCVGHHCSSVFFQNMQERLSCQYCDCIGDGLFVVLWSLRAIETAGGQCRPSTYWPLELFPRKVDQLPGLAVIKSTVSETYL